MPAVMGRIGRTYPAPQRSAVESLKEKVAYRSYAGTFDLMPWIQGPDVSPYRKKQAYRDMFNHDAVKAPLLQKVYSVSSLDLQTTPASDLPRDAEIADLVKYQWTDAVEGEFPQVCESVLLPALLCKHSICEKVWHEDPWPRGRFRGKRFYRTVKAKLDAKLIFDDYRNIVAVEGRDTEGKTRRWDPSDFVIFKHLSLFEDEGTSDLQAVYDLVWKLDTIEKLHNIHLDKFTSPAIVATVGRDVQEVKDPDTGDVVNIQGPLEKNVAAFKSRNWAIVPEGVKLEALTLATRGEAEFLAKTDELRQRIALAIAGAYLQMLTAQSGSGDLRGNAQTQKSTAELFVWALAAKLASILNSQATPELVQMNYAGADYPKISLGGVNYFDLGAAIAVDEAGQRMGFPHSKRALSRKYGWQEAADALDTLKAPTPAPAFGFSEPVKAEPVALPVQDDRYAKEVQGLRQELTQELAKLNRAILRINSPASPTSPAQSSVVNVFASPGKAVEASLEKQTAKGGDVGLAGADGKKAEALLDAVRKQGAAKLSELARAAIRRLAEKGKGALKVKKLFDPEELADLAEQIVNTNAPAELLGRARVREREQRVLDKGEKFSEETAFHAFDEAAPLGPMTPARALEYFRSLVPKLGVDPERWGPALERQAFTLAAAADAVLLAKVKNLIAEKLETGEDIGTAPAEIDALLDEAGVGERDDNYSHLVFRTNMMDSYNTGAEEEGLDVADTFPVWMMANPNDGRSRKTHAARNGNYYPNSAGSTFTKVRGTDEDEVINCRCTPIFVDKFEWEELQKSGARLAGEHGFSARQGKMMLEATEANKGILEDVAKGIKDLAAKPFPKIPAPVVLPAPVILPPPIAPAPPQTETQIVHRDAAGQITAIQTGNQWKIFNRDSEGNITSIERVTTE